MKYSEREDNKTSLEENTDLEINAELVDSNGSKSFRRDRSWLFIDLDIAGLYLLFDTSCGKIPSESKKENDRNDQLGHRMLSSSDCPRPILKLCS